MVRAAVSVAHARGLLMLKKLSLVLALASTAAVANAEAWRMAGASNGAVTLVDQDSVKKTGATVRYWYDLRFAKALPAGTNRVLTLVEADCDESSYRELARHMYIGEAARGSSSVSIDRQYAPPGSLIADTINAACTGKYDTNPIPREVITPFVRDFLLAVAKMSR